ncbi:MAG: SAM-dependent methyltransferase [Bacteroidetes bacterium]|nr:MAG: SAM-dependent methyltransferase [Bacteroidota bacterium]
MSSKDFQERLYGEKPANYALLDAGGGKKLERFGNIVTIRPEVQAYFQSAHPFSKWNEMADLEFHDKGSQKGFWKKRNEQTPDQWTFEVEQLSIELRLTKFKHLGVFPEQFSNWEFIRQQLTPGDSFLNLFAYTGMASLVARSCGAEVTHVDSVKQLISWSKHNMELSGLDNIRWIAEDAVKFVLRATKRGTLYQGIVLDPPAFGLGVKGEKWILDQHLDALLEACSKILAPNGFLILNTYSPKVNLEFIRQLANKHFRGRSLEVKELWLRSDTDRDLFFGQVLRVN